MFYKGNHKRKAWFLRNLVRISPKLPKMNQNSINSLSTSIRNKQVWDLWDLKFENRCSNSKIDDQMSRMSTFGTACLTIKKKNGGRSDDGYWQVKQPMCPQQGPKMRKFGITSSSLVVVTKKQQNYKIYLQLLNYYYEILSIRIWGPTSIFVEVDRHDPSLDWTPDFFSHLENQLNYM